MYVCIYMYVYVYVYIYIYIYIICNALERGYMLIFLSHSRFFEFQARLPDLLSFSVTAYSI